MKRGLMVGGIVVGFLLILAPFLCFIGMRGKPGVWDPAAFSASIDEVVVRLAAGVVAFGIGAVMLIVCGVVLVRSQRKPPALPACAAENPGK